MLGEPIKNRKGAIITTAWEKLHNIFKKAGSAPENYVLDNEISKDLLKSFDNECIQY